MDGGRKEKKLKMKAVEKTTFAEERTLSGLALKKNWELVGRGP